jgi:DNA-binding SARP family transcriptional activator
MGRAYSHLLTYDWFSAVDFQVHEHARVLARRLIEDALRRQDVDGAITYANQLLIEDSCDEFAYQAVMQAYLAKGERQEAARTYRTYQQQLQREMAATPSEDIKRFAQAEALLA